MKLETIVTTVSMIAAVSVFLYLKKKYNQRLWNEAMTSPDHQLQTGSFIFSKRTEIQSKQIYYSIFRVIRIDGEYVKLASVRQLAVPNNSNSLVMTAEQYENIKNNIQQVVITGILTMDFPQKANISLTEELLVRYPDLNKSGYYFEDLSPDEKTKPLPDNIAGCQDYMKLVYSAEHIIKNRRLRLYSLTDLPSLMPSLDPGQGEVIEQILNRRKS
ncbi:hypothetical protein AY601_4732 [Pedobacter cryoconitis]|uniref:Uncharacterized protein n=1 Tax=Pedobacter cryoconitis TaxID=188932 RepID=A0A127VK37_9SPHI|nr:hypothetical protein [Pedobacter cryoconitis]AMQ01561.1 hypothetical protein AY601_4732 [Pedobacter cryoconitis]